MKKIKIVNGNILKLIALITMTIDHIGLLLFPNIQILRIIGRISFPIFAFFIAEGCKYTKNKTKYFTLIFVVGLLCQLLISPFIGVYKFNILISFSLSISLIYLLQWIKKSFHNHNTKSLVVAISIFTLYIGLLIVAFAPYIHISPIEIEYGLFGIILPLLASVFDIWYIKLPLFAIGLLLISLVYGGIQYYCLFSLPILFLYNNQRGKLKLKYLFYIYYPIHFILLILIKACII